VAFSPDGQVVASASDDRSVRLWNSSTGEETQKLAGHDKIFRAGCNLASRLPQS